MTLLASSLVVAVAALGPATSADAATTVTPTQPGTPPVVRDATVHIAVDRSALSYFRTNATATFSAQGAGAALVGATVCRGDITATNNSPRTTVKVTDPTNATLLEVTSPVRNVSISSFTTTPKNQPLAPQPAASATNYRGDFPVTTGDNTYHGMTADVNLAGKPAGIYTVTTTNQNMVKTGTTCSIGKPGTDNKTVIPGVEQTVQTFEYRPWQVTFNDVFGKGHVSANTSPSEFTFAVDTKTSPIYTGTSQTQKFYSLSTDGFALPSDPAVCATDPSSCLPAAATVCDPSAGCTPRLMIINRPKTLLDPKGLQGVFDLATKAFIALAQIDGTKRTLMSLGTENDAKYHALLTSLSASAASQGIDLPSILATKVLVDTGGTSQRISLSLLDGLQVDPTSGKGGVQISSDSTAQAGIILDINSSLRSSGGACVAHTGGSASGPDRYTRNEDNGYTVTKSDLLPSIPKVGPLGAIVGGPIYHIVGKFNSDALVNSASAVVGLDTAVNEPNGYPVWFEPFISTPTHVAKPRTMDFVGTATWSASESPLGAGCLVVDFLLGTGVAVFNNPLPVGLGTIFDPLAKPTPAAQQLTDTVNDAVDQVTTQVSANPTVASLLGQLTALLPLS
ncbi:MAG: hypothetical protein JWQ70_691 [Aeromicrobium sp.]|nr:hypothetical protein [Aeromicrobium sp.]